MQETQVRSLAWEDSTCLGATKPVWPDYWARLSRPGTSACTPQSPCPQWERPPHWEAQAPKWRVVPLSPKLEKSPHGNKEPAQPKINKQINKITLKKTLLLSTDAYQKWDKARSTGKTLCAHEIGERIYTVNSRKIPSCLKLKDLGEEWVPDLSRSLQASPPPLPHSFLCLLREIWAG